jgi:nudix-type nucleoside diphosphatase (YffH/AdpP family)
MTHIKNLNKHSLDTSLFDYANYTFEFQRRDGRWQAARRIVLNRGDGAAILLHNPQKNTVILVKQLRLPTYLNDTTGDLIEACAGTLEKGEDPTKCIRREAIEETGFEVENVRQVFDAYMSPGVVTERLHLFLGDYTAASKIAEGGGLAEETEDIEILEVSLQTAMTWLSNGTIRDAKTIMLLFALNQELQTR